MQAPTWFRGRWTGYVRQRLTVPAVKSWGYVNDLQGIMVEWIKPIHRRASSVERPDQSSVCRAGDYSWQTAFP